MILIGRLAYLRGVEEAVKLGFDDVVPLPVTGRAINERLEPSAVRPEREVLGLRKHVLVVDDNAVNRRVLGALLEKLGCTVETARNGREAVDAAINGKFSVILMDCQMPVMNGYEATEEIRRQWRTGEPVPICGVSASMDAETRARCEASGMSEYMPKPVTLDMLQELLTRTVARQIVVENLKGSS